MGEHRPVCILGMHRTGTSLTAAVIECMGVGFGPSASMLPTDGRENPLGYFEQRDVRALNDTILGAMGGTWWRPPSLPPGWESDPRMDGLRKRAARLDSGLYGSSARWGFKDPRFSLTFAFWAGLLGEMDCVVCSRAPGEVAASLERRFSTGPQKLTRRHRLRREEWRRLADMRRQDWRLLAETYASRALSETVTAQRRICVPFDDWFHAPDAQLDRLGAFLGEVTPEARGRAATLINPDLRHHGAPARAAG